MNKTIPIILLSLSLAGCTETTSDMAAAIQDKFVRCIKEAANEDQKDICRAETASYLRICFNKDGRSNNNPSCINLLNNKNEGTNE